jgi:hypothetical protein
MDITIVTSDPALIQATEVAEMFEEAGYLVSTVTIEDREGVLFDEVWELDNASD